MERIPGIVYAFIHDPDDLGDPAKEIHLLVVGGPDLEEMDEIISEVEKQVSRTIEISSFTVSEFRDRIRAENGFVSSLIKERKLMLIGKEDEIDSL